MNGLIIFVKNPELGKVKTRIAKDAGDEKALEIYKKLLAYTKGMTLAIPVKRYVFYGDYVQSQDLWSNQYYEKHTQEKGDLGHRMYKAFEKISSRTRKMVLVGSDCTQISSSTLIKAYQILDKKDVVLGPTLDGGYYLIGMKKPKPSLFQGINWSTETVFQETIDAVRESGLTYGLLPKYSDIDYISDWEKYKV